MVRGDTYSNKRGAERHELLGEDHGVLWYKSQLSVDVSEDDICSQDGFMDRLNTCSCQSVRD